MQKSLNFEYDNFVLQYKYALQKSNEALTIESKGNKNEAYSVYRSIIVDIDNILVLNVTNEKFSSNSDVIKKLNNLKALRNNICDCINRIQNQNEPRELVTAEILFSITSECQYTKISPDGVFDIPSYPGSLEIYKYPSDTDNKKGFIVVSDWAGTLIENVTPILITPQGVLMFLDNEKDDTSKVAVTLPFNVSKEDFQRCICILSTLAVIVVDQKQIPDDQISEIGEELPKTKGEIIADGLNTVSRQLSKGVVVGASKLGELVSRGSDELCLRLKPGEAKLNPNVKTGLEYARTGTHALFEVSGKAFGALAKATKPTRIMGVGASTNGILCHIGKYAATKAAPHIISSANNLIPSEWKEKGECGELSKVDQIALVAGSGLQGLIMVFDSLHDGAVTFGRHTARSGGKIMRHRYGEEIGQTTENALYAAGNLGLVAMVALQFTKKGILKTAAKITALEVTTKYKEHNKMIETVDSAEKQKGFHNDKHI